MRQGLDGYLASLGPAAKAAVPELIEALRDRESKVRRRAVLALGRLSSAAELAIPDLNRMLRDDDEEIRYEATLALERIRTDK